MNKVVLLILDGFGSGKDFFGNAILRAKTPTFDMLGARFRAGLLRASGVAVGLPFNEPGNSEVGHFTIGAGRIIYQSLQRISFSIKDGSFFKNPTLLEAIHHVKSNGSTLHLFGLVSSGSVHSYLDHVKALIEVAHREAVPHTVLHIITDGRDALPEEGIKILAEVGTLLREYGGRIEVGTMIGRTYAMDRDHDWAKTKMAYDLLREGKGEKVASFTEHLKNSYGHGIYDADILPAVLEGKESDVLVGAHDALLMFNFRRDSMRQITEAFSDPAFSVFPRVLPEDLYIGTMVSYRDDLPCRVLFPQEDLKNGIGEIVSNAQLPQLRVAETDKYAHVTYFFNLGREHSFPNEERVLIPSLSMGNLVENPEMKAFEIAREVCAAIEKGTQGLIVANFANADMLGHTGNFEATVRAIEALDTAIDMIVRSVLASHYTLLITADHGNAEDKIDPRTGEAKTEHSMNGVPLYLVGNEYRRSTDTIIKRGELPPIGFLSDVAPTILEILKIPKPQEMSGISLLNQLIKN